MSGRLHTWWVTLALLACIFIGAAVGQAESVSLWTQYATNATLINVLKDFTEETGVAVDLKPIGWGTDEIFVAAAGGALPDLFTHGAAALGAFASMGIMAPMEPLMSKWSFTKDIIPAILADCVYQDKQVALPWNGIVIRDLIYQTDVLEEAGVNTRQMPTDWDGFVRIARKLVLRNPNGSMKRSAITLAKSGTATQQWFSLFHSQAGGRLLADGKPQLNDGTAVEALQFYVDLIHTYGIDDLTFNGSVSKHTSAMAWTSWGNIKPLIDSGVEVGIATFPYKKRPASFGGADWIAIPKGSRNPAGAAKLLEYLLHPEQQKKLNQGVGGAVPFYRNAAQWDWVRQSPQLLHLFQASAYVVPNPPHELWFEMRDELIKDIVQALKRETTPNAAMEQAQNAIMRLFADGAASK